MTEKLEELHDFLYNKKIDWLKENNPLKYHFIDGKRNEWENSGMDFLKDLPDELDKNTLRTLGVNHILQYSGRVYLIRFID